MKFALLSPVFLSFILTNIRSFRRFEHSGCGLFVESADVESGPADDGCDNAPRGVLTSAIREVHRLQIQPPSSDELDSPSHALVSTHPNESHVKTGMFSRSPSASSRCRLVEDQ